MGEVWKDVPGYERFYQASTYGRVKSLGRMVKNAHGMQYKPEKILKTSDNGKGYMNLSFSKYAKTKRYYVHQVIAMTFLGHVVDGYKAVIDHIDGNTKNNRVENLRITTQRENVVKSTDRGGCESVGVYKIKGRSKYRAQLSISYNTIFLGDYDTEEEASQVYQNKLKELRLCG